MNQTKRTYEEIELRERTPIELIQSSLKGIFLSPTVLLLSLIKRRTGARFHAALSFIGIKLLFSKLAFSKKYNLIFRPMDSVRYFEFDFFWKTILNTPYNCKYLDISSPRLFTFRALKSGKVCSATIGNPDPDDLLQTNQFYRAAKIHHRAEFVKSTAVELSRDEKLYDLIVCISVLEHIPSEFIEENLEAIWNMLLPGGTLCISVPCTTKTFDEYINIDEYGVYQNEHNGYVFGQTYYDSELLHNRFFSRFGEPKRLQIIIERNPNTFNNNRLEKLSSKNYPFWNESTFVAEGYNQFSSISDINGNGVIAMEFQKK